MRPNQQPQLFTFTFTFTRVGKCGNTAGLCPRRALALPLRVSAFKGRNLRVPLIPGVNAPVDAAMQSHVLDLFSLYVCCNMHARSDRAQAASASTC